MAEAQVAPLNFNPAELIKRVEDTEKRLQTKDAEIQVYKMLMSQMEEELAQAKKYKAIQEKQTQDVDSMKVESEKTLTKAKSLIFERTKIIKNQELQIEAFVQQIDSLKEVVRITKDLLELRNLEIKQLEKKISAIEGKMKAEQERYDLMHKKLEQMIRHNGELKREYETQLCLFSALRERYNERELAKDVVDDLKEELVDAKTKRDQAVVNNENLENVAVENCVENEKLSIDLDKTKQTDNTKSDVDNTKNNVEDVTVENNAENQKLSIDLDKTKQTDNTNSDVDNTKNNVEETNDKKEDLEPENNNSALVDAKNRLDNILSVLENTFGIDNMIPNSDDNKKEKGGLENISTEKNKPTKEEASKGQTVTGILKPAIAVDESRSGKVTAQPDANRNSEQAGTENVVTTQPDASRTSEQAGTENVVTMQPETSTLDNIISAIKTTVGLGSVPIPQNKVDDKSVSKDTTQNEK